MQPGPVLTKPSLAKVISWKIALAALLVTCLVGVALYSALNAYVLSQAQKNIQSVLLAHKGIHHYIQRNTHPALYQLQKDGEVAEDFYVPEILSSSFMLRNIHAYFNEERIKAGLPPLYYKMAAINPRNPLNQADELERKLIELFNQNREMSHYNEVVEIDGQKFLYYAQPFLPTNQACLKCHGQRQDAPRQLQARYQGQGGFGDQAGGIRAIEFVRAPLESDFKFLHLTFVALLTGVACLMALLLFNRRLSVVVRSRTQDLETELAERQRAEKELRAFFVTCPDLLCVASPDGLFQRVNPAWTRLLGYSQEELVSRPFLDLVHPDDRQKTMEEMTRSFSQPGTENFRNRYIKKDGSVAWLSWSASPSALTGLTYAVARDVTQHRQMETALKESEKRHRRIVETANEGIMALDASHRITFINKILADKLGRPREELLGRAMEEFVFPEDLADHRARMAQRRLGQSERYERRFRGQDGGEVFTLASCTSIMDQDGRFTGSFGMFTDITERKMAEEALRLSEEKFRVAFQVCPLAMCITRLADGEVLLTNDAHAKTFGYPPAEIQGRTTEELAVWVDPEDRSRLAQELARHGICRDFVTTLRDHKGQVLTVSINSSAMEYAGGICVLSVLQDLTQTIQAEGERKQLEAHLRHAQKMQAVGTLAGGIAHEFNNLLAIVMGYADLARDLGRQKQDNTGEIDQVIEAAERAGALVRQMLTFSRKAGTDKKPLSPNNSVVHAAKMLERTLPRSIEIETRLAPELPLVEGDSSQLEQILVNLATNARDAMPEGGKLTIGTELVSLPEMVCDVCGDRFAGDHVLLSVTDTGHGMDQHTMDQMYEPFFSTKDVGKGTGLGLSVVLGLVHEHGGHIGSQSAPQAGTTFRVYLPVLPGGAVTVDNAARPAPLESPRGTETILLVDDEEALRDLGESYLGAAGYGVVKAGSGEEALDIYQARGGEIALVLLDLGMPGMGGQRCLRQIMAQDPEAKVVIASGYSSDDQRKASFEASAAAFVAKPYKRADLLATVREVLDQRAGSQGGSIPG
jgi:PAS domain S-box-containing protein